MKNTAKSKGELHGTQKGGCGVPDCRGKKCSDRYGESSIKNRIKENNQMIKALQELQKPIIVKASPPLNPFPHTSLYTKPMTMKIGGKNIKLDNEPTSRRSLESHYDQNLVRSKSYCEKALNTLGFTETSSGVWSKPHEQDDGFIDVYDLNNGTLTIKSPETNLEQGINKDIECSGEGVIYSMADKLIAYRAKTVPAENIKASIHKSPYESIEVTLIRVFGITGENTKYRRTVISRDGKDIEENKQSCEIEVQGAKHIIELTKYLKMDGSYISHETTITPIKS